jgi:acyl-coenzyme A synthetase/AMP-(fatty) acid ligase
MQEFPTILHAIASHAETIPDKTAIIEAETDRKCTYGELWTYVKTFSRRLTDSGVKRDFGDGYGTRVVVRCTQTIDFVVSALAIQLAGGVFVPVEKNIADARIIEIMEETDSNILVAIKSLADYECTYIPISDATNQLDNADNVKIIFPEKEALSIILFTTGTTGKSKGVMHSFKSHTATILSVYYSYNHDNKQVWLIPNPLSHANGICRTYISLFSECTVVLLDGYIMAKTFLSAILKYKVTILNFMSAAVEMYLRMCKDKLIEMSNQINYIVLASSSFSNIQIESLRTIFKKSKIIQAYGATEISGCYIDHSQQQYPPFTLGLPYIKTEIVFYDDKKQNIINATQKNPGLYALSNDTRMIGYWKNTELTESVSRGKYIILSDLGYKGDDGLYYFSGRADDVITSGGYKIAPLEIEEIANSFYSIRESVCVPVPDSVLGQVPKLLVIMEDNQTFNFNEIDKYLRSKLEATKIPRYIEEIDKIPKINNKINRKEIRKE